jgi:hypothetical protein
MPHKLLWRILRKQKYPEESEREAIEIIRVCSKKGCPGIYSGCGKAGAWFIISSDLSRAFSTSMSL